MAMICHPAVARRMPFCGIAGKYSAVTRYSTRRFLADIEIAFAVRSCTRFYLFISNALDSFLLFFCYGTERASL